MTVLLSIYSNDLKTYVHRRTFTWMFIAISFINAKTQKQRRWPLVGEGVNSDTTVQWTFIRDKKKELSSHEKTLMNLQMQFANETNCLKCYILYVSNDMIFWKIKTMWQSSFNCIAYIRNNLTEGVGERSADLNKFGNK